MKTGQYIMLQSAMMPAAQRHRRWRSARRPLGQRRKTPLMGAEMTLKS